MMRLLAVAFVLFGLATAAAEAQTTRLIGPYAPGAANDTLARVLA